MSRYYKHHPARPAPFSRYQRQAAIAVTVLLFPLVIIISIPHPVIWLRAIEALLETAVAIAVVFSTTSTYRRRIVLFSLGAVALIASWTKFANPDFIEEAVEFAPSIFFGFVIFELTADVFRKGADRTVKLLAAINLYLLAVASFAHVHKLVEQVIPGAYSFGPGDEPSSSSFLYFSLTTQTTLGYGDIIPVNPVARAIAGVQATLGVLYLAVIVAAIIGDKGSHS